VASLYGESSGALGRDLVTRKQYSCVSASTTWTGGGLVPTEASQVVLLGETRICDQEAILLCECFNNVDWGWLSAYRYHEINRVSRVYFLSSLFTFPHYSLAILAFLYFPTVVSLC
jgi:hypothetical protein